MSYSEANHKNKLKWKTKGGQKITHALNRLSSTAVL